MRRRNHDHGSGQNHWTAAIPTRDTKVVGVTHLTGSRRQGMCRCRRHGGHHEQHEVLRRVR